MIRKIIQELIATRLNRDFNGVKRFPNILKDYQKTIPDSLKGKLILYAAMFGAEAREINNSFKLLAITPETEQTKEKEPIGATS
ncbi:MAG: hypothetical protein U9M89_00885 [Patescibacteria group bacterium]|nr:hypothetical protein [Patescibacteria group bacterium]